MMLPSAHRDPIFCFLFSLNSTSIWELLTPTLPSVFQILGPQPSLLTLPEEEQKLLDLIHTWPTTKMACHAVD